MAFTAKDVQALRQATGAGMMDCKNALVETGGDVEKAVVLLRERGIATAAKKAGVLEAADLERVADFLKGIKPMPAVFDNHYVTRINGSNVKKGKTKRDLAEQRLAIQGFGNVGSIGALLMHETGYKIIGASDVHGGLYNEKGLDVPKLVDWVYRQRKPLPEFPDGERTTSQEILFRPCEVLVPAAVENQITSENADQIDCKILCEGANGPTTAYADSILQEKGVFVLPDILANAGGVTVSYFEWVQDRQGMFWRENEVNQRLQDVMERSFDEVVQLREAHDVTNRTAAYMLAIRRVASALRLRGIYA